MANMEYCRFQNTLLDLKECRDVLDNREPLTSREEVDAAKELIMLCMSIAEDHTEYVPTDED